MTTGELEDRLRLMPNRVDVVVLVVSKDKLTTKCQITDMELTHRYNEDGFYELVLTVES